MLMARVALILGIRPPFTVTITFLRLSLKQDSAFVESN